MKDLLLTTLRDKNTSTSDFRKVADDLAMILASETVHCLEKKKISVQTPLTKTTGYKIKNEIILVPILRAGLAILPAFSKTFPDSSVGFIGLKRDEKTYEAKLYYKNIPKISAKNNVIILDPMLATGGSLVEAIRILIDADAKEEKIIYVGVVSAPE
jgi:uracil phosphoribosyltransferase